MDAKAKKGGGHSIFSGDGLTEEALIACHSLQIEPAQLKARTLESFAEKGVSEKVQHIRYQHHEEKRKNAILLVEQAIRIAKTRLDSPEAQMFGSVAGMPGLNTKYTARSLPPYHQEKPDIPLREPLDYDYKVQRKLAKNLYNKEKWNKVIENKSKLQEDEAKRLSDKAKAEAKRKQTIDNEQKEVEQFKKKKLSESENWRKQVYESHENQLKTREKEMRLKQVRVEEEYKRYTEEKEKRQRQRQEEMFNNDLMREKELKDRNGKVLRQKRREDEEVQQRLDAFNQKMEKHERQKVASVQRTIERMRFHTEDVRNRSLMHKEEEAMGDYSRAADKLKRLEALRKRKEEENRRRAEQVRSRLENGKERAKYIQDEQKKLEKDRNQYIMQRVKERDEMLSEMKEAMRQDVEQQKEIMALKKQDQRENFRRENNLRDMYKQRLVEKLMEKKERAERIGMQQARISEMFVRKEAEHRAHVN